MTDRKKEIADNGTIALASHEEIGFSETPVGVSMSMTALDVVRSVTHANKRNDEIRREFNDKT
jgi:hypothetical protein